MIRNEVETLGVSVGDKVTTTATHDWYGTRLASFVRTNTYNVIQVGGRNLPAERVVIGKGSAVTAAVHVNTLSVIGGTVPVTTPPAGPSVIVNETVITTISGGSDILANKILNGLPNVSVPTFSNKNISGSAVQYMDVHKSANKTSQSGYSINEAGALVGNTTQNAYAMALDRKDPSIVQNKLNFPKVKQFDSNAGYYRYDYYMDYSNDKLSNGKTVNSDIGNLYNALNLDVRSRAALYRRYTENYDKYKLNNPNDRLTKTFSHVFFVRPDCNIFQGNGYSSLLSSVNTLPEFYYASKHNPEMLRQLTQSNGGYNNQFMMYLSNKARSFEVSDEYISEDTYGQGLTGYKVPYGKDNVESRTSNKFSITYIDDRDLHTYSLHKLWIDYISYVFRGKLVPKHEYIMNKIIDYATCLYYIVCAEDGETVIFWSKYYGVFPIEAPSSGFSYSADNVGGFKDPELRIEYRYAWKEDFNPLSMIEFNMHCPESLGFKYNPHYQDIKLGTGYNWSGAPFIETFDNVSGTELPYTFKLRFRPMK